MADVGSRRDPLLNHNFRVSLVDATSPLALTGLLELSGVVESAVAGFSECTGLELTMTPEEFKEGGRNGGVLRFPSRITWTALTLKRGIAVDTALWDWFYGFVEGRGRRRDGAITLLDEAGGAAHVWFFRRGLPTKYSGPPLNATQNAVAIESIEISHEGLYRVPGAGGGGGIGALLGLVN